MILLVDDDAFVLAILREQLASIGWHQVLCASSGATVNLFSLNNQAAARRVEFFVIRR
jgi:CheY-like chemotaxis protein